jgi:hypothetical protein
MLDTIYTLDRLGIIENSQHWVELRNVRNHLTHESPSHRDFASTYLNKIIALTPELLKFYHE